MFEDGAFNHKIDYFTIFRRFKILKGITITVLVQKLRRFCWMGGFSLLVELHRWRVWDQQSYPVLFLTHRPPVLCAFTSQKLWEKLKKAFHFLGGFSWFPYRWVNNLPGSTKHTDSLKSFNLWAKYIYWVIFQSKCKIPSLTWFKYFYHKWWNYSMT